MPSNRWSDAGRLHCNWAENYCDSLYRIKAGTVINGEEGDATFESRRVRTHPRTVTSLSTARGPGVRRLQAQRS